MPDVCAVILAAGASRRLGEPKQLVEIEGELLLKRTVRLAHEAGCRPLVVVLGFEAERMRAEIDPKLVSIIVTNSEWPSGMGSSLRCGVEAAMRAGSENVLLLVCDQLALRVEVLQRLMERHRGGATPITASRYGGGPGVPAIFASSMFSELLKVTGDRGARKILEEQAQRVNLVDFPQGELDLDTREQLPEKTSRQRKKSGDDAAIH
jgi:molybdenum cofactor cytidylyltransferase